MSYRPVTNGRFCAEMRKRKSRWSAEDQRAFVPGMPTMVPSDVEEKKLKQYLCEVPIAYSLTSVCSSVQMEVEDTTRRLRMPDLGLSLDTLERYARLLSFILGSSGIINAFLLSHLHLKFLEPKCS